jgi:hypothetical protein
VRQKTGCKRESESFQSERRGAGVARDSTGSGAYRTTLWLESGGGKLEVGRETEDDDDRRCSGCAGASARLGGRDGAKLGPGNDEELSDNESDDTVELSDVRHAE